MIRFLIDTVSSLTDINGNRYHFATITSTKTGREIRVKQVGGESNARALLFRHVEGVSHGHIHNTHSDMKIREFNRAAKFHANGGNSKYEHEFTAGDFAALEE